MRAKNSSSNSLAMEIPQHITESLANGLTSKPIEVDYSAKLDQLLIDNQKELDAMVAKQTAILFYNYGLKPLHVRIWLYARFYSRRCLNKFLLIPLMRRQIRRKIYNIQQSQLW